MNINKSKKLRGEVYVPTDKSISHRAVLFGSIANGTTRIKGFLKGYDCLSTISCLKQMGVNITEQKDGSILVFGQGMHSFKKPDSPLYTGNSGTTTRILTGLLSAQKFESVIDGDKTIRKRPMNHVIKPLSMMGANIKGDLCPIKIYPSSLKSIEYSLPVASAQLKSAILAASLYADGTTTIIESCPSRNHTELMLLSMGADIEIDGNTIKNKGINSLNAVDIKIGADISSAAFILVAAALIPDSEVTVRDVNINPTRTGILDVLSDMGANIAATNIRLWNNEPIADLTVTYSQLNGIDIGGEIIPKLIDEIPIIAVAAACAKGKTTIRDAQQLKVKETDRIEAITTELKKAGIDIEKTNDGMIINGGADIKGTSFSTYNDHRMAMSLAVLAMVAEGDSFIQNPEVVEISFPGYFEALKSLQK